MLLSFSRTASKTIRDDRGYYCYHGKCAFQSVCYAIASDRVRNIDHPDIKFSIAKCVDRSNQGIFSPRKVIWIRKRPAPASIISPCSLNNQIMYSPFPALLSTVNTCFMIRG